MRLLLQLVFLASAAAHTTLPECLLAASVPVLTPSSSSPASAGNFTTAILPFNLRLPYVPVALAVPTTVLQVSAAVVCAGHYGAKVAARSGGHSYAAFGLGGQNGSLVVDMKRFRTLEVDAETQVATVGAGRRLGDIATYLFESAGRALPHGLCPGVGISGHALHGGFGFTSRMWGTTLDTILSLDVVLANGTFRRVSSTQHADLFWALRGAGSSFGLVTSFRFRTFAAPVNGVVYNYTFPSSTSPGAQAAIFAATQGFAHSAPSNLAVRLFLRTPAIELGPQFFVSGVFWGSRAGFDSTIAPLLAAWPADTVHGVQELPYLDALVSFNNGGQLPQPKEYTEHGTFFAKSVVTPEALGNASLASFFGFVADATDAPVPWWVIADLYGGANSRISNGDAEGASYAGRTAFFTLQLYSISDVAQTGPYPAEGIEFMDALSRSITEPQGETQFMAYPNYVDPTYSAEVAHGLYYGEKYERLLSIKRRVDPEMRFWNPQAIGVE